MKKVLLLKKFQFADNTNNIYLKKLPQKGSFFYVRRAE